VTQALFNQGPVQFVMGNTSKGLGAFGPSSRVDTISLREIFQFNSFDGGSSETLTSQVGKNLQNNAASLVMGMAGIAIGKKLITATGISRNFNSAVRGLGMGSLVKM